LVIVIGHYAFSHIVHNKHHAAIVLLSLLIFSLVAFSFIIAFMPHIGMLATSRHRSPRTVCRHTLMSLRHLRRSLATGYRLRHYRHATTPRHFTDANIALHYAIRLHAFRARPTNDGSSLLVITTLLPLLMPPLYHALLSFHFIASRHCRHHRHHRPPLLFAACMYCHATGLRFNTIIIHFIFPTRHRLLALLASISASSHHRLLFHVCSRHTTADAH